MEIFTEKTKLMTKNTCGINTEIKVNGQKLAIDTGYKYLVKHKKLQWLVLPACIKLFGSLLHKLKMTGIKL